MLYSALSTVYIIITHAYSITPKQKRWLAFGLSLHALLCTYLVTATTGKLQLVLFHLSFCSCEVYIVVKMGLMSRSRPEIAYLWKHGLIYLIVATVFWEIGIPFGLL